MHCRALQFNNRDDMTKGTMICIQIMAKFSLTIQTGRVGKNSKNEALFIPCTTTIKRWRLQSNNTLQITDANTKPATEIASINANIDLSPIYSTAPETEKFIIDDKN